MRTALCIAIGLAVPVIVVPASLAHGKSAETGTEAKERQTHQRPESNSGISIAEPIGRVSVGPKLLDGEPVYVRRTTVREGMTIVEVSTTPFMPVLLSKGETAEAARSTVRPDQPASW
jgi:hypothetical protein